MVKFDEDLGWSWIFLESRVKSFYSNNGDLRKEVIDKPINCFLF